MIGFGELRKKSVAWQMEISAVEKIYALHWLLKSIVERDALHDALTLRDAPALAHAYFENYPRVQELEFARAASLGDDALEQETGAAIADAARASGLQFKPHSFQSSQARIEFTGPLGRRSAAQPLLIVRFVNAPSRAEPEERTLLYPFGDVYAVRARAVALRELAAERIVLYSQKPRARDVFDLWFILKHGAEALDKQATLILAQRIAGEKRIELRTALREEYAPRLERAWENALQEIRPHPSFETVRADLEAWLERVS